MATYNIFLGSGVRSVGDVTLMRRNGKQVARLRLRTIKNPRSEAQATQRNFVAPVMRFYGALRTQLKGSYQGYNNDQSYNQFQRTNIALARTNGWYIVKGAGFYPMPYQLSRGSITPVPYYWGRSTDQDGVLINLSGVSASIGGIGTLSKVFIANGYKEGDVVTIIAILLDEDDNYYPESCQFYLNPLSQQSISSVTGLNYGLSKIGGALMLHSNRRTLTAGAVIVSRNQGRSWLRSTQTLAVSPVEVSRLISQDWKDAAIASYMAGGSEGGGGVYPGGDGQLFSVAARDGRALLFVGGQFTARRVVVNNFAFIMVKPDNLDEYFYIMETEQGYITCDDGDQDDPASWQYQIAQPADLTISNSILNTPGSSIDQWLTSIGCEL